MSKLDLQEMTISSNRIMQHTPKSVQIIEAEWRATRGNGDEHFTSVYRDSQEDHERCILSN